jgi:hypothetical protein
VQTVSVLLVGLTSSLTPIVVSSAIYLRLVWFKKHWFDNRVTLEQQVVQNQDGADNLEAELEQQAD